MRTQAALIGIIDFARSITVAGRVNRGFRRIHPTFIERSLILSITAVGVAIRFRVGFGRGFVGGLVRGLIGGVRILCFGVIVRSNVLGCSAGTILGFSFGSILGLCILLRVSVIVGLGFGLVRRLRLGVLLGARRVPSA